MNIYVGIMFITFLVLLLSGLPIFAAIGLSSVTYLVISHDVPLMLIPQKIFVTVNAYSLLAIPLFTVTGYIMEQTTLSIRLVEFVECLLGGVRGSMGAVTIVTCAIFAALTGSGPATVAAIGVIIIDPSIAETVATATEAVEKKEADIMKHIVEDGTYIRPWVDEKLKEIGCEII